MVQTIGSIPARHPAHTSLPLFGDGWREIQSIVFDLDGTLYVSEELAASIQETAEMLVADSRGLTLEEGRSLLRSAQRRLFDLYEEQPTLSRTCMDLGIELVDFHRSLQTGVHPERYLSHDPILGALLDSLANHCDLYIYTNNNLFLARKILALLGVEELFRKLYTIEFAWRPKPERDALQMVLEDIGGPPESFLFAGDRQQVDLQGPAELGIPTLLVRETADLLQIHRFLGIIP